MYWLTLPLNPEAWAVGPMQVHKKAGKVGAHMGRNHQLASYKEAVREMAEQFLTDRGLDLADVKIDGYVELHIFFWRRLDTYENAKGKNVTKHWQDVTNIQKSTEDALSGLFYEDDRKVIHTECRMMVAQGTDVEPLLVIGVGAADFPDPSKVLPGHIDIKAIDRGNGQPEQTGLFPIGTDYDESVF